MSTVINGSTTATANPDRLRLNDTINFLPDPTWLSGTVSFWADIINGGHTIATSSAYSVTFRPARPLHVGLIPIEYQGRSVSPGQYIGIESWAKQVYPTASVVIHIMPSQKFTGSSPSNESTHIWLQGLKSDWESKNQQALNTVYGLFPDGAVLGGQGIPGYRSAIGEAWPDAQQKGSVIRT